MKSFIKRHLHSCIACLAISAFALQTGPANAFQKDLPSGESVLKEYIEASGGQTAFDEIKNRYIKATLEIVSAGVSLDITTYAAKPNKVSVLIESPAIGVIKKGSTGKNTWSMSEMQGPVVEQGASLENQLRDSIFDRTVYWQKAYESAKCVAVEKIDDRECYKVILTPRPYKSEGSEDVELSLLKVHFDKETKLPAKIESNVVSDAGTIDVTAYLSDYKTVDGIKIPFKTKMNMVGQTRIMTIETVKHNVELDDHQFDPPTEIVSLIKKQENE